MFCIVALLTLATNLYAQSGKPTKPYTVTGDTTENWSFDSTNHNGVIFETGSDTATHSGTFDISSDATFYIISGKTLTHSTNGTNGSGILTIDGGGTFNLATNGKSIGGFNIQNGTFLVSGGIMQGTTSGTITVGSNGTLTFGCNDSLGYADAQHLEIIDIDGGKVYSNGKYNALGSVTLRNGGKIIDNGGLANGWPSYALVGTVTVPSDTTASIEKQVTSSSVYGIVLYSNNPYSSPEFKVDNNSTLTISADLVDGDSNTGTFKKTGDGTLTITGANNTYTGGTTISEGTLKLTQDGTLGTGSVSISENGTLEYNVADSVTKNIANSITGTGTILKSGDGVLVMAQDVAAKQFNVDAGTLQMTSNTTLNGSITIDEDGKLELGIDTTPVSATIISNLTVEEGGKFNFNFSTDDNDLLNLDGNFTLNDQTVTLSFLSADSEKNWFDGLSGDGYQLIAMTDNTQTGDLSRYLDTTGLTQDWGLTGLPTGLYLTATPAPGSGVPEPSTWALLILGFAGLMWYRKRERR